MKKIIALFVALVLMISAGALPAFAAKKADAGILDVGNKICPVSGDPISGKDFVVYKDKRYNLCCPMCKKPFSKDPEKYVAKVNAEKVSAVAPVVSKSETMEKDMDQGSL